VTYVFMAVHYPEPGARDDIYASMSRMAESMARTLGLIEIGPWLDRDGDRSPTVLPSRSGSGPHFARISLSPAPGLRALWLPNAR
jgi:hypothetical protein